MDMISSYLQQVVRSAAEDFDVDAVWLFGSAVEDEASARDIDLAVEGLPQDRFFDFYGRLYFKLPKPVDLVDLSQDPPIASIIRAKGVRLYERGST
jgi:predicted nucleotidyltransferase